MHFFLTFNFTFKENSIILRHVLISVYIIIQIEEGVRIYVYLLFNFIFSNTRRVGKGL